MLTPYSIRLLAYVLTSLKQKLQRSYNQTLNKHTLLDIQEKRTKKQKNECKKVNALHIFALRIQPYLKRLEAQHVSRAHIHSELHFDGVRG